MVGKKTTAGKRLPAQGGVQVVQKGGGYRRRKSGQFAKGNRGGPGRPRKPAPEPERGMFLPDGSIDVDAILGDSEGVQESLDAYRDQCEREDREEFLEDLEDLEDGEQAS